MCETPEWTDEIGRLGKHAQESVQRGADPRHPATGGGGADGDGRLPQAWHQRGDVLPLEGAIRRGGGQAAAGLSALWGRETPAEAERGGSYAGQSRPEG